MQTALHLTLAGCVSALSAAGLPLSEDGAFIPYLAEPARHAPATFVTKNDIFLNGILAGPVALVAARTSWGIPYGVEAAYRWENGAWQTGVPWLPADRWPQHVRRGYLAYQFQDPETSAVFTEFLDAATGEVRGRTEGSIYHPYHFDINEHAIAVTRGFGPVEVYPHDGERRSIPVRGSSSKDVILDGRELVVFSYDSLDRGSGWLERISIDTGEVLDSWTLPPRSGIYAFHAGKILVAEYEQWGSFRPLLARVGVAAMEPLVLPEAAQPGSRMLTSDALGDPNPAARTPTGVWLNLPAEKQNQGALMHFDLSGDTPGWSLGIDSSAIFFNGYRVVTRRAWNEPLLIADADPATLPTAFLIPSRSPEITGVLPVKVRLDRPSAATVKVRVTSKNGGTATPGADYTVFDQWITFPPGAVEAEAPLIVKEDFTPEPHETLVLEIAGTENANLPVKTEQVAVIEASGVQQTLIAYPDVPANPGPMSSGSVTGGDGLVYRVTGPEWPTSPQPGVDTPPAKRIEVSDPRTGTVLEFVTIRVDPLRVIPAGIWLGDRYSNGVPYAAGGTPLLRPTVDGVIARYHLGSEAQQEWKLSASRTYPAFSIQIGTAVEGGAAGVVRLTHLERGSADRTARIDVTDPNLRRVEITSYKPYSPLTPAVVTIPADGSPADFFLPINPWQWTSRRTPLRLLIHDGGDVLVEDTFMEPAPGDYVPASTTVVLDPALSAGGMGNYIRRGDGLWISFPHAINPATGRAGCVQEIDAVTYAPKRIIWAPSTLKHSGFGQRIIDAGRDLIVLAEYYDDRKRKLKISRTLCVIDAASGNYRAVIPWKFYEDPSIVFDDNYLAIASHSYDDGDDRWAGGLSLYSRSTYKLAGSLKFVGRDTGRGIAIAGGSLWVGMPMTAYRPAGLPKKDPGQIGAGAVLRFAALPSLKSYQSVLSPAVRMQADYFGRSLDTTEDGFLIVGADNGPLRLDPSGQLPAVPVSGASKLLPSSGFSSGNGLRTDFYHAIYDETTGLRLADFYHNGLNAIAGDDFLYSYPGGPLLSVPLERCGSFELWQRFAPEIPGDSRPDIQRYVEEHLGELPEITVTPKYDWYRSPVVIGISSVMPPDTTMLVEYSVAGGPWQLAALRQGLGPVRDRKGTATKDLPDQIETPDSLPTRGIRFRAHYNMTTAIPLSSQQYRHQYVKP